MSILDDMVSGFLECAAWADSVGHGTGFWDETGLPEGLGDRLSKVCGNAEFHMWQNDAGLVEMEG